MAFLPNRRKADDAYVKRERGTWAFSFSEVAVRILGFLAVVLSRASPLDLVPIAMAFVGIAFMRVLLR